MRMDWYRHALAAIDEHATRLNPEQSEFGAKMIDRVSELEFTDTERTCIRRLVNRNVKEERRPPLIRSQMRKSPHSPKCRKLLEDSDDSCRSSKVRLTAAPSPQTVERNRTAIENLRLLSRNVDRSSRHDIDPSMAQALRQQRDWLMANLDKM